MKRQAKALLILVLLMAFAVGMITTVRAEEAPVPAAKYIFMIASDEKDTVLTDPAKHAAVENVLKILLTALPEGNTIVVTGVPEASPTVEIQCGDPEGAAKVTETVAGIAAAATKDKLDSQLTVKLNAPVISARGENDKAFLLTDGLYTTNSQEGKNIDTKGLVIFGMGSRDAARMQEMAGRINAKYVDLTGSYTKSIIHEIMPETEWWDNVAPEAEPLLNIIGYYSSEKGFTTEKQEGGSALVTRKPIEFSVTMPEGDGLFNYGDEIKPEVVASEGLKVTCLMDGNEIETGENYAIPTDQNEAGDHKVQFKADNDALNYHETSEEFSIRTVAAPKFVAEAEMTLSSTVAEPKKFVTSITKAGAFDNDDDDVVISADNAKAEGYNVYFDDAGTLVIEGTPNAETVEIPDVTLSAKNADGATRKQDLKITLEYFPAKIRDIKPEIVEVKDFYTVGDEVDLELRLDEESAKVFEGKEEWIPTIKITDANGTELPYTEGIWPYHVTIAKDTVVNFNVNGNPVCTFTPNVYKEDELFATAINEVELSISGLETAKDINAECDVSAVMNGDVFTRMTTAPDRKDFDFHYSVAGGEAQKIEGSENSMTAKFTLKARDSVDVKVWVEADGTAYGEATATLTVKEPDQLTGIICKVLNKHPADYTEEDFKTFCIYAGAALAALIILIIIICLIARPKFKGTVRVSVENSEGESFEGKPVRLESHGKGKTNLGNVIAASGLPPISILVNKEVTKKVVLKPVGKGIRVINSGSALKGNVKNAKLTSNDSVEFSSSGGYTITLEYKR